MVRSVLVAGGRSRAHRAAFERAIQIAESERARLTVVCVIPPMPRWLWLAPVAVEVPMDLSLQSCLALRRELLDLVPAGLPVTSRMMEGPERRALLTEVRRADHDLVVVSHPRRRTLPGVAWHDTGRLLVRRSAAMVMVVPPNRTTGARSGRRHEKRRRRPPRPTGALSQNANA